MRYVRTTTNHLVAVTRYGGIYRMKIDAETFGQIKKEGTKWSAEARRTETGEIVRFGGIWNTLRDAVDELFSFTDEGREAYRAHRANVRRELGI